MRFGLRCSGPLISSAGKKSRISENSPASAVKQLALQHGIAVYQPTAEPARSAGTGRTGRAQSGSAGGGRLRPDPAAGRTGHSTPGLYQQPCLAHAALAGCADPTRHRGRRSAKRRDRHAHGSRAGHRHVAQVSTPISATDTGGSLHDALGNPTGFVLTPGQAHDLRGADVMLKDTPAQALLLTKPMTLMPG